MKLRKRLLMTALALALVPAGRAETTCDRSPLLITGGRLWQGQHYLDDTDLLIRDGRIVALGAAGTLKAPPGTRTLQAEGHSLLPGLIDAHAHFFELGGPTPEDFRAQPEKNAFAINGRQLLIAGVTTARVHLFDLEHGPRLQEKAEDDCFAAPRLVIAGPGFFGGRPELAGRQVWGVSDPEDARAKVRRARGAGARGVAIHDADRFEAGELEAIVDEARRQNLWVMAAGDRAAAIERALRVGVDSVDYMELSKEPAYPARLMTELSALEQPPTFVPMLGYYQRFLAHHERPGDIRLGPLEDLLPAGVARHLISGLGAELAERREYEEKLAAFSTFRQKFEQLREAGLPLAMGTDCGSPGHFHHDAMWWELSAWQSLGASPREALQAATLGGARLLRRADLGRIAIGARGDVVLYHGEVGREPADARKVIAVLKGGVVYVRGQVSSQLSGWRR